MRNLLEILGQRPDEHENLLPTDHAQRHKAIAARQIQRVTIAFISGPVEGYTTGRVGVPKSYPYTSDRGFFRVMILDNNYQSFCASSELIDCVTERLGVGELELFSLRKLPELDVKEVLIK